MKMKKLLLLIAVAITIISCGNKNNIRITGTVEAGLANGDSLYLVHIDAAGAAHTLASCAVENGAFKLEGVVNAPALCNIITYNKQGRVSRNIDIIAEDFPLEVTVLQNYARVTGSPLNDKLQSYNDSLSTVKNLYKRYYDKKANNPTLSDKAVDEADKVMAITATYHRNMVYRAIEQNIDNIVGLHIIKTNFNMLEPVVGLKYIEQLPANYKNDYLIAYMRRHYTALSRRAVGAPFADFASQDSDGNGYNFSASVGCGVPVVLTVWATDNRRSINELSLLKEFATGCLGEISFVAVSLDTDRNRWLASLKRIVPVGMQLNDFRGWSSSVLAVYGIDKCPYYILIDKNGIITYRGLSLEELMASAEKLLKE